jgi:hypothetical protein
VAFSLLAQKHAFGKQVSPRRKNGHAPMTR